MWTKFPRMARRCLTASLLLPALLFSSTQTIAAGTTLTGWFTIVWGDQPAAPGPETYWLTTAAGQTLQLDLAPAVWQTTGGALALNGQRVMVTATQLKNASPAAASLWSVQTLQLAPSAVSVNASPSALAVIGAQPWVSILCKYSDNAAEPKNLAYFTNMYSSTRPGLDHYWRELSYDLINVVGSNAYGWYTLPHNWNYYFGASGQGKYALADDCLAQADPTVNFSGYVGINMMFNDDLDGYAWGGKRVMTLDGVTKVWNVTWEPPWGYANVSTMAHEMGHGFGLPHSAYTDAETYDNQWDVLSDTWSGCSRSGGRDATYGCVGQHTIAWHKALLGWIAPSQRYTVTVGARATLTLEQIATPATGNYQIAMIPVSPNIFYTVEARRLVGYDTSLPGAAVIIHQVDTTRANEAHVIGTNGGSGAMWVPGEIFTNASPQMIVCVLAATATGYTVHISNQAGSGCVADLSQSTSRAVPSTLAANQTVTVTTRLVNSSVAAEAVVVTATLLSHTDYLSAATTQGAVSGSGPLVYTVGTLSANGVVTLTYQARVQPGFTQPAVLTGNAHVTWSSGSLDLPVSVIANGESVYLPFIQR